MFRTGVLTLALLVPLAGIATAGSDAVHKTNVVPAPPGAPDGQQLFGQLFACYKFTCVKIGGEPDVADQFGSRLFTWKGAKLIFTPANGSPPVSPT